MNQMFINIRSIVEDELRLGTQKFYIYPFAEVGHTVKEIVEWDYGKQTIPVDDMLSKHNKNILSTKELKNEDFNNAVVLLSPSNSSTAPFFRQKLVDMNIPYRDIHEKTFVQHHPKKKELFKTIKKLLKVKSPQSDKDFVRVGRDNDGGYIMLNDFEKINTAYSFGISDDVSWDKYIAARGIKCHMYDHTINKLPEENPLFMWEKKGLSGKNMPEKWLFSLETLMRNNGDLDNKNMVLKMDVEGAEWDCIENTPSEILDCFAQMVFELHGLIFENPKTLAMVEKLNLTHTPVWIHGNNVSTPQIAGDIVLTPALEVLYLNNKRYKFSEKTVHSFPWKIDMPNDPRKLEVPLGDFSGRGELALNDRIGSFWDLYREVFRTHYNGGSI